MQETGESVLSEYWLEHAKGTQNFAKGKMPIEVEAARKQMLLKVLWVAVKHKIPPFIFQMDKTGFALMHFGEQGLADRERPF